MENNLHKNIIKNLKELYNKEELSKKFEVLNEFSQEEFEELLLPLMLHCFDKGVSSSTADFLIFINSISK